MNAIDTKKESVMEFFLNNGPLSTPPEQRYYSWQKKHMVQLWNDLRKNFIRNEKNKSADPYLLGSILVLNSRGKQLIIDGQQRLATVTMLLCIARDMMAERRPANAVSEKGLDKVEGNLSSAIRKNGKWNLTINKSDQGVFETIQDGTIWRSTPSAASQGTSSRKRLVTNYKYLRQIMEESVRRNFEDNSPPIPGAMWEWTNEEYNAMLGFLFNLFERILMITIVVHDPNLASQAFETINARGFMLTQADLIKKHALGQLNREEIATQHTRWNGIFDRITMHTQAVDLLLDSYRSNYCEKKVTSRNLYRFVREKIPSELSVAGYIDQLDKDSNFLSKLYDTDCMHSSHLSRSVHLLGAVSIRAPLLAANDMCTPEQYNRIGKLLVKFFFKTKVILRMHAGRLDGITTEITKKIRNADLDGAAQMLISRDNHEQFKTAFRESMKNLSPRVGKYVLLELATYPKNGDAEPAQCITLEHVLPLKPEKDEWPEADFFKGYEGAIKKDMGLFKNHLGNMALLTRELNSALRNKSFAMKKVGTERHPGYCDLLLNVNYDLRCRKEWTASVVEERGNSYAERADAAWDITKVWPVR